METKAPQPLAVGARLRQHRYRRQFLAADARLGTIVILSTTLFFMPAIRNDYLFWHGTVIWTLLLVARVATIVVMIISVWLLRRARTVSRHDFAYKIWIAGISVVCGFVHLTRWPLGEVQGPLMAVATAVVIFCFTIRGPLWPRMLGSIVISLSVLPVVWSPHSELTSGARLTATVVTVLWNIVGYVVARNFEEQRYKRFLAELEEKRARRELTRKVAELAEEKLRAETMARARTAFLATMSHEFRTPMNAVLGFSELVLAMDVDMHVRDHVNSIRDSARSLLGLLNDVLDFAKIDADKLVLTSAPFHLRHLLTSVMAMMEPMVSSRPVVLELQSSPNVPDFVVGDEHRLRQVLVNLLSNAVKFTERGHVRLIVTAQAEEKNNEHCLLTFRVEDSGMGMDAQTLSRLFQPFMQGEQGITRRHQGTGLGLAITKRIVQAMGGDLRVTSEVGQGSKFVFTIKLSLSAAVSSLAERLQPRLQGDVAILVVDDNSINRRLALAMLDKLGYKADIAEDGAAAISAAREKDYDVIFMDLHMPEMSGLEAAAEILKLSNGRRTPQIVAMTASVFEEDREACRQVGMQAFVAKPMDLGELDAALRQSVNEARRQLTPPAAKATERVVARIDFDVLNRLRQLEDAAESGFFASILRDFLGDAPQRLERLRKALDDRDPGAMEFEAHTLKSTSRMIGAVNMGALCARIEENAKLAGADFTNLQIWVDALDAEFRGVEPILAREMTNTGASSAVDVRM